MKTPYEIIRKPVITEKGLQIKELQRTMVFEVAPNATKPDIRRAVEQIFKVKVESVRTMNYAGKFRRQGAHGGRRSMWKKAYVKLKAGEKMVEYLEQA